MAKKIDKILEEINNSAISTKEAKALITLIDKAPTIAELQKMFRLNEAKHKLNTELGCGECESCLEEQANYEKKKGDIKAAIETIKICEEVTIKLKLMIRD